MAFIITIPNLPSSPPLHNRLSQPICHASAPSPTRRSLLQAFLLTTTLPLAANPAFADHTYVAARRSYDRYHPRILEAIDILRSVREAVKASDASSVASLIEDKQFDIKARRALSIYATSFSDNYLGERSRAMLKSVDGLYKELTFVKQGVDMQEHYGKALDNLEEYYREARLPAQEISDLGI